VPGTPARAGIEARIEIVRARLRRIFDLDADVAGIERRLSCDSHLRPLVEARPGLRVPGTWDPFELAVRAILGQQVSVPAARTLAGRFAATHGRLLDPPPPPGVPGTVFPSAADVRPDELVRLGVTRPRAAALASLARKVAADPDVLATGSDLDSTVARLTALPGVGPWTAQYIAMRALREPDAFPHGDLGLLRALEEGGHRPSPAELLRRAEAWRPYRAYAALHLWSAAAPPGFSRNKR
jgi:AraC family transcriptional regulator of adaptative response / DNA-3-methyladenine glycosylase II